MLPLPYGLMPHELIEVIDNERILSGISKIYRLAEDYPNLDSYSYKKHSDNVTIPH
jgi:hypothetical protein